MSNEVLLSSGLPLAEWAAIEAACALNPIARRVNAVFEKSQMIEDPQAAMEYRNAELLTQARTVYFDTAPESDSNVPDKEILMIFNGLSRRQDTIRAVAQIGVDLAQTGMNPKRARATIQYAIEMCQQALAATYQIESPDVYQALQLEHARLVADIEKISGPPESLEKTD